MSLIELPIDILAVIAGFIDIASLGSLERCSKHFLQICRSNLPIWRAVWESSCAFLNIPIDPNDGLSTGYLDFHSLNNPGFTAGLPPVFASVDEYRIQIKKKLLRKLSQSFYLQSRLIGKHRFSHVPSCHGRVDADGHFFFPWSRTSVVVPADPTELAVKWPLLDSSSKAAAPDEMSPRGANKLSKKQEFMLSVLSQNDGASAAEVRVLRGGFPVDPKTVPEQLMNTAGVDLSATALKLISFLRLVREDASEKFLERSIKRFSKYVILILENRSAKTPRSAIFFPPPDVELVWITCMLHPHEYARSFAVIRGFSRVCFLRELLAHHSLVFLDSPALHKDEIEQTENLIQKVEDGSHSVEMSIKPSDIRATLEWSAGFDRWLRDYTTELRRNQHFTIVPVCTRENPLRKIRYRGHKRHLRDPTNMELTPELLSVAIKEYEMFLYESYKSVQRAASSIPLRWRTNTPPPSFGRHGGGLDDSPTGEDEIILPESPPKIPFGSLSPKLKLSKANASSSSLLSPPSPRFEECLEDTSMDRNEYHRHMNYIVVPVPVRRPEDKLEHGQENTEIRPCFLADLMWHSHMLHPYEYEYASRRYVGCFLNHVVDPAEETLRHENYF